MHAPDFGLWAAWAAFGVVVLATTILFARAALTAPNARPESLEERRGSTQPWLYCEEGAPLDQEVRWFRVRLGARTVLGSRPRSATADTSFIYLNAHDVVEDNALIVYDAPTGRYHLHAPPGARLAHNNEPLTPGEEVVLTDGDMIGVGQMSRFRFTLTGPPDRQG
jgi:hypothetical protein